MKFKVGDRFSICIFIEVLQENGFHYLVSCGSKQKWMTEEELKKIIKKEKTIDEI